MPKFPGMPPTQMAATLSAANLRESKERIANKELRQRKKEANRQLILDIAQLGLGGLQLGQKAASEQQSFLQRVNEIKAREEQSRRELEQQRALEFGRQAVDRESISSREKMSAADIAAAKALAEARERGDQDRFLKTHSLAELQNKLAGERAERALEFDRLNYEEARAGREDARRAAEAAKARDLEELRRRLPDIEDMVPLPADEAGPPTPRAVPLTEFEARTRRKEAEAAMLRAQRAEEQDPGVQRMLLERGLMELQSMRASPFPMPADMVAVAEAAVASGKPIPPEVRDARLRQKQAEDLQMRMQQRGMGIAPADLLNASPESIATAYGTLLLDTQDPTTLRLAAEEIAKRPGGVPKAPGFAQYTFPKGMEFSDFLSSLSLPYAYSEDKTPLQQVLKYRKAAPGLKSILERIEKYGAPQQPGMPPLPIERLDPEEIEFIKQALKTIPAANAAK